MATASAGGLRPPTGTSPHQTVVGQGDRGGGPIELAVILPLLLLCVFGVVHLSTYYLAQQAALSIAQIAVEGERGFLAEPGAGERRAEQFAQRLPGVLQEPEIEVTNDGGQVTVTVTGTALGVIPWLQHSVTQTASGPVERVT